MVNGRGAGDDAEPAISGRAETEKTDDIRAVSVERKKLVGAVAARSMAVGNTLVRHVDDHVALVVLHDDLAEIPGDAAISEEPLVVAVLFDRKPGEPGEAALSLPPVIVLRPHHRRSGMPEITRQSTLYR